MDTGFRKSRCQNDALGSAFRRVNVGNDRTGLHTFAASPCEDGSTASSDPVRKGPTTVALDTQAGANAEIRSTRLLFLIVGFGVAAWAPLVPFVAARAGLVAATPGGLLLCLGIGSLAAMRPRLRHRP